MLQRFAGPVVIAVTLTAAVVSMQARQPPKSPRIEVAFTSQARAEPVTGMVYVAVSRDNQRTPIEQAGPTGVPLFDVRRESRAGRSGGI